MSKDNIIQMLLHILLSSSAIEISTCPGIVLCRLGLSLLSRITVPLTLVLPSFCIIFKSVTLAILDAFCSTITVLFFIRSIFLSSATADKLKNWQQLQKHLN